MKSCGPRWLKNSLWKPEGSKNLTDCRVGWTTAALRLTSVPIKIATNSHFCLVPSFHRANHDAATAKISAQVPPYIKPERAAAQNQTVPLGTERRSRCWRLFQETERTS